MYKRQILYTLTYSLLVFANPPQRDTSSYKDKTITSPNYQKHIKPIIDEYCIHCHGEKRKYHAPISLHTYKLLRAEIKIVQQRINSEYNPMPATGKIDTTLRKRITDWVNNGMPFE